MHISLRSFRFLSAILPLSLLCNASHAQLPATPPSHIVVLIMENYAYADIIGSSYAPHINAICADTNAAVFTKFYAIEHPSQPNYLDMFAGGNQGNTDDALPIGYPFTSPNLAAQLIGAGKTFVTYSEDLPSVGYDGATYSAGGANYVRKHNPVTNWVGTGTNQVPATVNQPYTAFPSAANYASLPTVCYVVPNQNNDMHDGFYPTNITTGDTWIYNHLDSLRQWSLANNTLYIIIYDEDDDLHGNNVPAIFYGPMVKGGIYNENVNLFNLLRTMEDLCSIGHAGTAADSAAIIDCWKHAPISTGIANTTNNHLFTVMPNPASEVINFDGSNLQNDEVTITITNASGRMVGKFSMTGSHLQVNTSTFAPGIYSFNAIDRKNQILEQGKFVITHN